LLFNLVKNSREAMPTGGKLLLRVRAVGDLAEFLIADTGSGIPEDVLSRIFDPFFTHGKSEGTGLGMAIAKSVVEAHGGTIQVKSEVGKGTMCSARLPIARGDR
jgi:signal transduction histidine kinase